MVIIKDINKGSDRTKLLSILISEILDRSEMSINHDRLRFILKSSYGFDATLDDIHKVFETNIKEAQEDLRLQCKNLDVRYD